MIKPNQTVLLSMMRVNLSTYEDEMLLMLMVGKKIAIIFAVITLGLKLGMLQLPHFSKPTLRSVF